MKKRCSTTSRALFVIAALGFVLQSQAQLTLTLLHSFSAGADGQQPYASLIQATDLVLYGTTYMGGTNNAGTVFKVNPDGSGNRPIYSFGRSAINPLGVASPSGLIQGVDGALYGTTGSGGQSGYGSVFKINTDGSGYVDLHSFDPAGGAGYNPSASLVQATDGNLYGTTENGGAFALGTVFKIGPDGSGFTELYSFGAVPNDATSPVASLIQGADGALYGTSSAGGASAVNGASGYGCIFKINTDGSSETVLHSFFSDNTDGQHPYAGLTQDNTGRLYGTTQEGGSFAAGAATGFGTVFTIQPDGTGYAILHSFNPGGGDGKYPHAALVLGNDGGLYGTTEFGGTNNMGIVFRLSTDGSQYSVLFQFGSSPSSGRNPNAPLVRAASGGLFGTAQLGGAGNGGTLFRLNPSPSTISLVSATPTRVFSLTATPDFRYSIETSPDALHWALLTNLVSSGGVTLFSDPAASNAPTRFYRAAWVP
ncbi:MAG TPA: choice-of-anchor tandem repeat GloVer-containing protein [Verrucomicrobiae bacterium]|nr:choice-of-anchor tandem repeat GloVer-containing protein [Verrucomicrobiae bacterium]